MLLLSFGVNCHGLMLIIHIKILVITILLPRNKKKAIFSFLLTNKWPNQNTKQHNKAVL